MLPKITCFLVKIASRCNFDCDYCYMYHHADHSWQSQPSIMSERHRQLLAERIGEYVKKENLERIVVVFHGGEPLLARPQRIVETVHWIRNAVQETTKIDFSLQTNGALLDDLAIKTFMAEKIGVSLSLDGPKIVNDRHRLTTRGESSFAETIAAMERLKQQPSLFAGVIAVIDPFSSPEQILEFFDLHIPPNLDFLLPDANYLSPPPHSQESPDIAILNELWCKIPAKFSGFQNKFMEKLHKLMLDRFKAFKLKKMLANPLFGC